MTAEFEGSIGEVITPAIDLETALFIDQHVDDGTLFQVLYADGPDDWTTPLRLTGDRAFLVKHDLTVRKIKFVIRSKL